MSNPSPQLESCRRRAAYRHVRPALHAAAAQASRHFRSALLLPAIVCTALALALAGCGGSSKSAGSQTSPGTAASPAPGTGATSSTESTGATSSRSTGGTSAPAGKAHGSGKGVPSAAAGRRLSQFAVCMRKNGVNVPPPGTSSKGPALDLKGIDTTAQA